MLSLYYNNTDILPKSNNLAWSSDGDNFGIELSFDSLYDLEEGESITLWDDNIRFFEGIIVKKSYINFSNSYSCLDYSFYGNNETLIQFNKTAASNALKELWNNFGVYIESINIPTLIDQLFKDKSLNDITKEILELAETDQGKKYFSEFQGATLKILEAYTETINPKLLISKEISYDTDLSELRNKIIVVNDGEESNTIHAVESDNNSINKYGLLQEYLTVSEEEQAKAINMARNTLAEKNRIKKNFSFNCIALNGGCSIKANRLIDLGKEFSKYGITGKQKIKSASHSYNNKIHKVDITLEV
ncbi:XkdQ/YqbQ family protein [Clostridium massiliamazoniense]|uniref:XkdQ/YqbQ family protein n=1 Tax=Clostridium massiliamazoniense TaxID=1347366 RepID=UPI0006D8147A|nr:hypothetical protein [Clostridium massiliamazoniense]